MDLKNYKCSKIISIILFLGILPVSYAQQGTSPLTTINRDFYCYDTDKLMKELISSFEEAPIVLGKTNDQVRTTMSLWINNKTKTWTFVATKENISCIIGSGSDIKFVSPKGIGV